MKIWFDILTPKQYLFFEYFIQKLRKQHKIFCTSRKYEQVNGITKFGSINPVLIGKHGGGDNSSKLLASLERSKLLTKKIESQIPDLLISFCSPEASRVAFGLGIPHIAFSDSPHAKAVMRLSLPYVTKLLTPWIIPKEDFVEFGIAQKNIIKYKAIDAGVIIKKNGVTDWKRFVRMATDEMEIKNMDVKLSQGLKPFFENDHWPYTILIRPEETEAAYITKKSKTVKIIQKIVEKFPDDRIVVLSRYKDQSNELKKFFGEKILLHTKPVDGYEIFNDASFFVGSGGTMTAESALLGIPTISMNAVPNRIEDFLVKKKLIIRSDNPERITKEIVLNVYKKSGRQQEKTRERAEKILRSFEDPYPILLKTIKSVLK